MSHAFRRELHFSRRSEPQRAAKRVHALSPLVSQCPQFVRELVLAASERHLSIRHRLVRRCVDAQMNQLREYVGMDADLINLEHPQESK